jgi:hypothetical protein
MPGGVRGGSREASPYPDFAGKAVILVTLGVGRRGYAEVHILGFVRSMRGLRRGDYVTTEKGWSTS